jgi:hypothetical protein
MGISVPGSILKDKNRVLRRALSQAANRATIRWFAAEEQE